MGVFNSIGRYATTALTWAKSLTPKIAIDTAKTAFNAVKKMPKVLKKALLIPTVGAGILLAGDALFGKKEHSVGQTEGFPPGYNPYGDSFGYQDCYNPLSPNYNPGSMGVCPPITTPYCAPSYGCPRMAVPRYHSAINPFNY